MLTGPSWVDGINGVLSMVNSMPVNLSLAETVHYLASDQRFIIAAAVAAALFIVVVFIVLPLF